MDRSLYFINRRLILFLSLIFLSISCIIGQEVNSAELGNYYRGLSWNQLMKDNADSALFFNRKALAGGPIEDNWARQMEAERQYIQAHIAIQNKEFNDAIAHAERAEQICPEIGTWGDTLQVYAAMLQGHIFTLSGKLDKAEPTYEEAYKKFKQLGLEKTARAGTFMVNWGLMYQYKGDLEKAREMYQNGISIFEKSAYKYNLELSKAYLNLGTINIIREELKTAINNFQDVLYHLENGQHTNELQKAKTYYNLAVCMIKLADFESASRYLAAAKDIYKKLNNPREYQIYFLLGPIYNETGQWDKAIEYTQLFYRKAVGVYGPKSREVCSALGNLAQFYLSKGDPQNAKVYNDKGWGAIAGMETQPVLEAMTLSKLDVKIEATLRNFEAMELALDKARKYAGKLSPQPEMLLTQTYINLSYIFYEQGDYDRALYFGRLYQKIKGDDGENSAGYYIVNALMGQNKLEEAEENIQKAYEVLNVEIDLEAPRIKHKTGRLRPSKLLVQNLTLTGRYYRTKAESSQEQKDWLKSFNAFQLAANYLDSLRLKNKSFDSQTELLKEKHRVFEQGLKALYELYAFSSDEKWVSRAFEFAEKSKAILLSESLNAQQALTFSGIPEQDQKQEQSLRKEIYYLQKQIDLAQAQKKPALLAKVEDWNQQIFELSQQYEKLAAQLRKKYPAYMEVRYQPNLTSTDKARQSLRTDEALVEYFVGDSAAFAIVLTKEKSAFIELAPPKMWNRQVKELREEILASFQKKDQANHYPRLAYELYQQVWEPVSKLGLPEKITLVPDGPLGYLSFDVLLTAMPTQAEGFKNLAYLIREHQFRYTYSAKLLTYEKKRSLMPGGNKFIAFAPVYPSGDKNLATLRGDLADLPYAYEEAQKAQEIMGGELLSGEEASEDNFKLMADAYKVIHIAAHARVDDQNPLYSSIYFSPEVEGEEDQALEVFELFNMKLKADLIVLSACETGVGEMKQGEGIISLAWGASYAGAKSVLTSLWQVNDLATSKIIEVFYSFLEKGMDKDEALRQAKLKYLEEGDHLTAHPFYWGGFILIGDYQALGGGMGGMLTLGFILLAALGIGLGVYLSRRGGKLQP